MKNVVDGVYMETSFISGSNRIKVFTSYSVHVNQGDAQLQGLQLIQLHRKVCRVLPVREMKCRLVVW